MGADKERRIRKVTIRECEERLILHYISKFYWAPCLPFIENRRISCRPSLISVCHCCLFPTRSWAGCRL